MTFTESLTSGTNFPSEGQIVFDSSDHIRFQNGVNVSGHNYDSNRRIVIEKNITGNEGYTITIYNMDGIHPLWQNNIQMAPKPMKITSVIGNEIQLRGYGYDENAIAMGVPPQAASFASYGIVITIEFGKITQVRLDIMGRNVSLLYLQ